MSEDRSKKSTPDALSGTTLKVYRILYREGSVSPLTLGEIQRRASLSSPSVAHYHVNKLLEQGLVKEKDGGYIVDRVIFENMMRIRRSLIPLQSTFAVFFAVTLGGLLFVFRPKVISSLFVFALVINLMALGIFAYQTFDTLRKSKL